MLEPVWQLPGPRSMINDALQELGRGRHVALILPQFLARDEDFTDVLAGLLSQELQSLGDVQRVYPQPTDLGVSAAIGRELDVGRPWPVTVGELVWHEELRQSIALLAVSDLDDGLRRVLPRFLLRLDSETRGGVPGGRGRDRLRLVLIATRGDLPDLAGANDVDITLSGVWWWNRVDRWDVGSLVSRFPGPPNMKRVLADVRSETIVEVSRWQLKLAEHLSRHWSGDPAQLKTALAEFGVGAGPNSGSSRGGHCGSRPYDDEVESWDAGWLDGWHDRRSAEAVSLLSDGERLDRAVWAAQARILLPWVEQHREALQAWLMQQVGKARFRALLEEVCDAPPAPDEVVEIGPLKRTIDRQFRNSRPEHLSAARRLHSARNALAHLKPMSLAAMIELVAACEVLTT